MSDNNEIVSISEQDLSDNLNSVGDSVTVDSDDDNTLSSSHGEDNESEKGIVILRPDHTGYNDKFYPWSKISNKLGIINDELMLANIFDYMKKYKTLKKLLSKNIPVFINDGKIIYNNIKVCDIESSPIMLLKETSFNKKNKLTNNYSEIISNLISSSNFLSNSNLNSPEDLFGNLVNAMTSGMQLENNNSIDNELENESDEESEGNLENENVVNDNSSLNIVNQLLSMYNSNSTNIQTINNNAREKYKDQIEQMKAMGLNDENKLLQSLTVCDGNVEHAVNYYFGME